MYNGAKLNCNFFLACPRGTYADGSNLCIPCPDIHHITIAPAIGKNSCKCKPGYQSAGIERCEVIKCSRLSPPDHGYFVKKRQCSNVLNSACGVRCLVGYTLTGSSIRLCQSNASWSGYNPSCHSKFYLSLFLIKIDFIRLFLQLKLVNVRKRHNLVPSHVNMTIWI